MTRTAPPTASFEALHTEYAPRVRAYLQKYVDATEAEDLTQEVFLKVHHGLAAFRGDSKVSTWIFQIATHAALDRLRSPRHRLPPATDLEDHAEHAAPSHAHQPLHAEMCRCIRTLVDDLPVDFRTILHLSELKVGEIARILDITPGAAKIRLHRARKALRERMEADCRILLDERAELQCDRKPGGPGEHR